MDGIIAGPPALCTGRSDPPGRVPSLACALYHAGDYHFAEKRPAGCQQPWRTFRIAR